jgi:hypothetical protein
MLNDGKADFNSNPVSVERWAGEVVFKFENRPCFEGATVENQSMVEIEVYAAGVRAPDKMLGLALESDVIPGLRYKVDKYHDIDAYYDTVCMEFAGEVPQRSSFRSHFFEAGTESQVRGAIA